MKKIILSMHVSLDGYVAGSNGEMDWILINDELFDFVGEFTSKADTALYGRVTYDIMDAYWPTAAEKPGASKHDKEHSNWYNTVDKIVISNTMQSKDKVKVIRENIHEQIRKIKSGDGGNILSFGSPRAAQELMRGNLIDEFWLFVNPILLGKGMPLFTELSTPIQLEFVESKVFSCGVIALHYCAKQA